MGNYTEQYTDVIDRTGWLPGPWDDEPDKLVWTDTATGLPCMIKRNHMGFLCGYVGVGQDHDLFGRSYDSVEDFAVHGGLTFASLCDDEGEPAIAICHLGEETVWWFGFDCCHYDDAYPYQAVIDEITGVNLSKYGTYKTVEFVRDECTELAWALAPKALHS